MVRKCQGWHRSRSDVVHRTAMATTALLLTLGAAYLVIFEPIPTSTATSSPSLDSFTPAVDPAPSESTPAGEPAPPQGTASNAGPPEAEPTSPTTSIPAAAGGTVTAGGSRASERSTSARPLSAANTPCNPLGLTIPDLGVNASVVPVGLAADGSLGTPSDADKRKAGWFPNSVLVGSAHGTVIMDGHTYHDETAIFRTDFNVRARAGMSVQLLCVNGNTFNYVTSEVVMDLSVSDYDSFVTSRRLYATDGPARVVIITCTDWNPITRQYRSRGVLIAVPR